MSQAKSIYTKDFKDYLSLLIPYIRWTILHSEYHIGLEYSEELMEGEELDDTSTYATIISDDVYLAGYITIYPPLQKAFDQGKLRKVAEYTLHELCHLITQPLVKWARSDASPSQMAEIKDVNERQTQRIANAVNSALPSGWWKPERLRKAMKK